MKGKSMAMDLNKLREKKGMPIPTVAPKKEKLLTSEQESEQQSGEKPKAPKKKYVHPGTPKRQDKRLQKKGRLPHGSFFDVKWDATTMLWKGRLTMNIAPGSLQVFYGEHSGVFQLLHLLDDMYRAYVEGTPQG
jgi:hypothetical protein